MNLSVDIRHRFPGFALDVAFEAPPGVTALLGRSGSGKTTVVNAVAGLLHPDAGRIALDSEPLFDADTRRWLPPYRRRVGYVFQEDRLFPHFDVRQNLRYGQWFAGVRHADAEFDRIVDLLGIRDLLRRRPAALSGGEKQRVSIGRTLLSRPRILLMDEPLAALDVQQQAEIRQHLQSALDGFTGARVLVTHDPVDALTLADQVVVLEAGRAVQDGAPDEIVAHPGTAYVADLVGVNLYRGEADGRMIRLGTGGTLAVAGEHHGAVHAIVAPHAVVLHSAPPAGTARNVWRGVITRTERLGDRVRVRVDCEVPVVAEVTPAATDALSLAPGVEVWAAVKATEIVVHPA